MKARNLIMADIILDQLGLKDGDIFKQTDIEKIDSNAVKTQDAINSNSNKIGVLTTDLSHIVSEQTTQNNNIELKANAIDLGNKSNLPTTDKTSFEKAVIEIFNTLTTKLSKSQIQSLIGFSDINKNLSQIDATMLTPTLLQQIAGTAGVNVTPSALSVLTTMLSDLSVTPSKTNFITTGKNLFDKSTRTIGQVVSDVNGTLTPDLGTGYDSSDYIPVKSGVTYFINKCRKYALYNSTKGYVSGYDNTTYGSVTFTPTVDGFIRFYVGQSFVNTTQMEIGTASTTYEKYSLNISNLLLNNSNLNLGIVNNENIKSQTITDDKINPMSNIVIKKVGKNLFDFSKATSGYYIDYNSGNLIANANNSASDFIPVLGGTVYTLSNLGNPVEQLAYYDSNKVYISGVSNTGVTNSVMLTTPVNACYVRISSTTSIITSVQLEIGSMTTNYENYSLGVKVSDIEKGKLTADYLSPTLLAKLSNIKTIITVKQDGTGDFTSLRSALESISDATINKKYEVQIYEGTYDVFSYYTSAEINATSFIGLIKPDYVDIIGIGDKKKIILKGELPSENDVYSADTKGRVSTLCWYGNGKLENLTITGKNQRYAVHDDYNYPNSVKKIINCDFIRFLGNGINYGGEQAWGEGSWSGMDYVFEDCNFSTEWNYFAYTTHNNFSFTNPTHHKFINCKFITTLGDAVRFESLGSGQHDTVQMIGCKMNGDILLSPNVGNTTGGNDYTLSGYGNDIVPVKFTNTDGVQYVYDFIGETKEVCNAEISLTKGTPVRYGSSLVNIRPLGTADAVFYIGIALQDIPASGKGIIKTNGYLAIADTNLTGLVLGDKIGLVNGVLAKVTTGDYIGVVTINNYIKLK
jgi:hypothetical protein